MLISTAPIFEYSEQTAHKQSTDHELTAGIIQGILLNNNEMWDNHEPLTKNSRTGKEAKIHLLNYSLCIIPLSSIKDYRTIYLQPQTENKAKLQMAVENKWKNVNVPNAVNEWKTLWNTFYCVVTMINQIWHSKVKHSQQFAHKLQSKTQSLNNIDEYF